MTNPLTDSLPPLPEGMDYLHVVLPMRTPATDAERQKLEQVARNGVLKALEAAGWGFAPIEDDDPS